jgi:hypothetical protein
VERLRAIWARWRLARLEKHRQREAGHVGQTVYGDSLSPQDVHFRRGTSGGGGGAA